MVRCRYAYHANGIRIRYLVWDNYNPLHQEPLRNIDALMWLDPIPWIELGNDYIMLVVNYSTWFCVVQAVRDATTQQMIWFLEEQIILKFGLPNQIITDKSSIMIAREIGWYVRAHGIHQSLMIACHWEMKGLLEHMV